MKRLVAIVEDEPAIRENYAAAFTREGYAVRSYANRSEAMAAFGARLPDLAVIDISLQDEPETASSSLSRAVRKMIGSSADSARQRARCGLRAAPGRG